MYIYVPTPGGPCTLLFIGRACDGPTQFGPGEFLLCLYLHQTAELPMFLWGIWERETVTQSVAKGMYYIMARFFVVWCNLKVDAQNTPTPIKIWALLTIHATNGN